MTAPRPAPRKVSTTGAIHEAALVPAPFIPTFDDKDPDTLSRLTSSLLYFDRVSLFTPFQTQDGTFDWDAYYHRMADLKRTRGEEFIGRYTVGGITPGDHASLTPRQLIDLLMGHFFYQEAVLEQYSPLISNGSLVVRSLGTGLRRSVLEQELGPPDATLDAAWNAILVESMAEEWVYAFDKAEDIRDERAFDFNQVSIGCAYLLAYKCHTAWHSFLDTPGLTAQLAWFFVAKRLAIYLELLASSGNDADRLSFDEMSAATLRHLSVAAHKIEGVPPASRETRARRIDVAVRLLNGTLAHLPAVLPRSAEVIVQAQTMCRDELLAFRGALDSLSWELAADPDAPVEEWQIERTVATKLIGPAQDLERRLRSPGKDLMRHLFSSESIMRSVVTLSLGNVVTLEGGAVAAALVPVLAAAVKARSERVNLLRQSQVGYLLRLSQLS